MLRSASSFIVARHAALRGCAPARKALGQRLRRALSASSASSGRCNCTSGRCSWKRPRTRRRQTVSTNAVPASCAAKKQSLIFSDQPVTKVTNMMAASVRDGTIMDNRSLPRTRWDHAASAAAYLPIRTTSGEDTAWRRGKKVRHTRTTTTSCRSTTTTSKVRSKVTGSRKPAKLLGAKRFGIWETAAQALASAKKYRRRRTCLEPNCSPKERSNNWMWSSSAFKYAHDCPTRKNTVTAKKATAAL
mmetsp:Transcript_28951/g.87575  ORF Transcript_28951/g.87575 Transcript_28951/m.87575 type:complete len:246 (-) Transcript_28951:547-1284(-)